MRLPVVATLFPLLAPALTAADGTLVVLNKQEGTATLVDLASGASFATVDVGHTPHEGVVSRDGKTLYAANYPGRTLTAVDLVRREKVDTIELGPGANPHGLAWAGDRLLVTMESKGQLAVVDPEAGAVAAMHPTGQKVSHMVAVSPDGKTAYTANIASGSMTAIDLESGEIRGTVKTDDGAEGIDVSPDGSEVWVANNKGDSVSVVDATTLKVAATIDCPGFPIRVKLTPDGATALVSCPQSGELAVLDARTRAVRKRVAIPKGESTAPSSTPIGILVHPGGSEAYVACAALDEVVALDLKTFAVTRRFATGSQPDGLALGAAIPGASLFGAWAGSEGEAIFFERSKLRVLETGEPRFFRASYAPGKVATSSFGKTSAWKVERTGDAVVVTNSAGAKTYRRIASMPAPLDVRPLALGERRELPAEQVETIRGELRKRVERDQAVRKGERNAQEMEAVDLDNTAFVSGLVRELGWIDAERFGAKAASGAFLLVQHSGDLPLMMAALPEIERDAKAKRVDAQDYALLFDRVRVMLGEKQRYGSQIGMGSNGLVVVALEDRARVDDLRRELGLMPLAQYVALFEKDGKKVGFEEG